MCFHDVQDSLLLLAPQICEVLKFMLKEIKINQRVVLMILERRLKKTEISHHFGILLGASVF